MRSLIFDEPVSRTATWAQRLASLSLLLAILAVVVGHARGALARFVAVLTLSGGNAPQPSLSLLIFAGAIFCAGVAVFAACCAAVIIWRKGLRGIPHIVGALFLVALLIPYPAWLLASSAHLPWLSDISTDIENAPSFSLSRAAQAGRGWWTPTTLDPQMRQAQADAYPDVQPIVLDMDENEAFAQTRATVEQLHWTILDAVPPGGKQGMGHIDALTHTTALSLPVAIAIRIKPLAGETRVDVRTSSRYLPHDLGAGADLIGKLSDALQEKDDAE